MRAAILAPVTAIVLALTYAALDDVTTGKQPGYTAEYVWLTVAAVWLIAMGFVVYRSTWPPSEPGSNGAKRWCRGGT